jgi:hypothetical protein
MVILPKTRKESPRHLPEITHEQLFGAGVTPRSRYVAAHCSLGRNVKC